MYQPPLYLFGQFFQGKAIETLLGEGVKPESLNDDRLGNGLDELYAFGLSEIFLEISLASAEKFGVKREVAHLDSTSFHVDGAYASTDAAVIEITYGYSRDDRPDLKQFMMKLICVGDGDIPVLLKMASGNQSDKARFAQLFQDFSKQWTFDGLCGADGALYSADNIPAMAGLNWLTRVSYFHSSPTSGMWGESVTPPAIAPFDPKRFFGAANQPRQVIDDYLASAREGWQ